MLVDATSNHPTCKTYLAEELTSTKLNLLEARKVSVLPSSKRRHLIGHAVGEQSRLKHDKYAALMAMVMKQQFDGKRDT